MSTEQQTPRLSDAGPVAIALFGFTLALFGLQYALDIHVVAGLNYALLVSGAAEVLCGFLCLARGLAYSGYVLAIYGFWVVGLYLLLTVGVGSKAFTTDAVAWYVLLQLVPTVYLAVPAFVFRHVPFIVAFLAIAGLILALGIGTAAGSDVLTRASGWFAFVGAAAIWFVGGGEVLRNTGARPVAESAG